MRLIKRVVLSGLLLIAGITMSGCISWNVHTELESRFHPDGRMKRRGQIVLRQFEADSLQNYVPLIVDSAKARKYVEKRYVHPPSTEFIDHQRSSDSSYTVNWSHEISQPSVWFWDYKRLTSDSAAFSGNRIRAIRSHHLFSTEYEYREVFFDALIADSVIAHLPEVIPFAQRAFLDDLRQSTSSRRALSALETAEDEVSDELVRFWNSYIKPYLYDPENLEGEGSMGDSLHSGSVAAIMAILDVAGGKGVFSYEDIDEAIEAGNSEIQGQFELRGFVIGGAYNIGGDDQFSFVLKLHLPGRIEAANADSVDGNYLEWRFSNYEFRGKELLLYARSSEYHWWRLIAALFVVGIVAGAIVLAAKRYAQNRT